MEQEFPPDWAIEEAIKRSGIGELYNTADVKELREGTTAMSITLAARLIAQHEEPPVDPLVQIVREIGADIAFELGLPGISEEWRKGKNDAKPTFRYYMRFLERGIEIGKEQARGEG